MTEEGKFYWLRVKDSKHPFVYIGETKAGRGKYTQHVEKPSCCLTYNGGAKLDQYIADINAKNRDNFNEKQAAFEAKYPPGTPPAEISPTLIIYEPVEVVRIVKDGKTKFKLKHNK